MTSDQTPRSVGERLRLRDALGMMRLRCAGKAGIDQAPTIGSKRAKLPRRQVRLCTLRRAREDVRLIYRGDKIALRLDLVRPIDAF